MKKPFFILLVVLGFVLAIHCIRAEGCCGCGGKDKDKGSKNNGASVAN